MITNVYIDGFNLYNRALKNSSFKWLDLNKLCQNLIPHHQIHHIRYFTATVHARPDNIQAPQRQQIYLRALRTLPNIEIVFGQFRARTITRPLVNPFPGYPRNVSVHDTEEKGTDVNLATYLLVDGYEQDFEQALIISNDADLALPMRVVRDKLSLPIGIVNPNTDAHQVTPAVLRNAATFHRQLRVNVLSKSQMPQILQDENGTIHKPSDW